jgi:hypothetical protein
MHMRFYRAPATGEPYISHHGVTAEEVEEVLRRPGEDRHGREGSRVAIGQTRAGRSLRGIYVPDPEPDSICVITTYELRGSRWRLSDGGSVGKDRDETGQIATRLG